MEKVFIDTSGWVALFVANDINHTKAVDLFNRLSESKALLYTSDFIFDETITTILVRGDRRQSVAAGEAILASRIVKMINISTDTFNAGWALYKKFKDKHFSFTDVCTFALMKEHRIHKAFSFDKEFVQAGIQLLQ